MRNLSLGGIAGLIALAAALLLSSRAVQADQASCDKFRSDIVEMDAKSSKLPGYLPMRARLSSLYERLCASNAGNRAAEYWFDLDGKSLGSTENPRPRNAAYATTAEIGRACAEVGNPSVCALERGTYAMCKAPPNPEAKTGCDLLGAYPTTDDPAPNVAAAPLPPMNVSLEGRTYLLDADCYNVLAAVSTDDPADRSKPSSDLRYRMLDAQRFDRLNASCPGFLNALIRQLGVDPQQAPARFWPALTEKVGTSFTASGTGPPPGQPGGLPLRFCQEVENKMNTCRARWNGMATADSGDNSTRSGQAGAFGDCFDLYRSVYGMCRITRAATAPVPPPLPKTPPPPPAPPPQANTGGPGQSNSPPSAAAAPPPAIAAMSPTCKALLTQVLEGADTGDNAKAQAAYGTLRGAECDSQIRTLALAANTGLPERKYTSRARSLLDKADKGDLGATAERIGDRTPASFDNGEILDFAIAAFTFGANVAIGFSPSAGGTFSSMGRTVTHTYGQGAPARPAPVQRGSTITK